jgi:hypothetical protein
MNLDRVTVTGADDSIKPEDLVPLTEKYPFVEWGILFSGSRQGGPRYPSDGWISKLMHPAMQNRLPNLCAHLCGKWVRDLVLDGKATWWEKYRGYAEIFKRVQLNFHGQFHKAGKGFSGRLKNLEHDFILQHDGVNDATILALGADLPVSPLFDRSGGAGVLPASWPKPIWKYQGYAGGLSPENIEDELHRILDAAGESRIWIDVETRVRSEDDGRFDLGKVELFLKRCQPFVRVQS